jgi:uncharacterized membrane protein
VTRALVSALSALAALAYPFAVYALLGRFDTRTVALGLVALVALRAAVLAPTQARELGRVLAGPALALGGLALAAAVTRAEALLLAAPALASFAMLATFARSLQSGPPFVERLARATNPDLTAGEVVYCRDVTRIWCAFFAANGAALLVLALLGPRAWWLFYAGLGSYLLMGLLFACEYVVRRARFGRFEAHPLDRALAKLLGAGAP